MDVVKNGRTKQLQPCGCNCGHVEHWHRLRLLRGPDHRSHFVRDECREAFKDELQNYHRLGQIRDAFRTAPFWKRWPAAKVWWALQYQVRVRLLGPDEAARCARRDALLFVLPNFVARIIAKHRRSQIESALYALKPKTQTKDQK